MKIVGIIEIILASVGFGFIGFFSTFAINSGLLINEVLAIRFLLASAILGFLFLIFDKSLFRINFKSLILAIILGVFGYAVFSTLYLYAIKGVSISLAVMLLYTYPFWLTLLSHFFSDEKFTKKTFMPLLIAGIGLFLLLITNVEIHSIKAFASGLLSGLMYALYIFIGKKFQGATSSKTLGFYVMFFSALALGFFSPSILVYIKNLSISDIVGSGVSSLLGLAIFSTIVPLILVFSSLQKLSSRSVGIISLVEPITAVSLGIVVFNEVVSFIQIAGIVLIITAIILNIFEYRIRKF